MPESLNIAIFAFGAILLLLGLVGGKFKLFGSEVSGTVGTAPRVAALVIGIGLLVWGSLSGGRTPASAPAEAVVRREPAMTTEAEMVPVVAARRATAPSEPATEINISGMWQDETGTVYRIAHHGNTFEFQASNSTSGTSAEGRGTLQGRNWESTFRTNYSATGTGSGIVSTDGNRMTGSFSDTRYGLYSRSLVRFQ